MPNGYPKFKGYLVEKGISQSEVADFLGYSRNKLNLILNGGRGRDFKASDIVKLANKYDLDVNVIFFNLSVASSQRKERCEH